METRSASEERNMGLSLPLSSLSLLVPPLRLVSAAMWQVVQKQEIMHYGKLEELVSLVTETAPELLSYRKRTQLILALRAKLILELCRSEHTADPHTIQLHLDRIRSPSVSPVHTGASDVETEESEANFLELVQTLLEDPAEREHFFQEVFPVQFGPKYDTALQVLVWEFLSRLEQLLPVPDLQQTVCWLGASPSVLAECMQSICNPQQLQSLLQHHRGLGHLNVTPNAVDDCMLSSLSIPAFRRLVDSAERTDFNNQSESKSVCDSSAEDRKTDWLMASIDHTRAKLTSGLNSGENAQDKLTRKLGYGMSKEEKCILPNIKMEEEDAEMKREDEVRDEEVMKIWKGQRSEQKGRDQTGEIIQTAWKLKAGGKSSCIKEERGVEPSNVTSCLAKKPKVRTRRGRIICSLENPQKQLPGSPEKGVSAEPSHGSPVNSPTKGNPGQASEGSSQGFTCSQCPFVHMEEEKLHQHIEKYSLLGCYRLDIIGEDMKKEFVMHSTDHEEAEQRLDLNSGEDTEKTDDGKAGHGMNREETDILLNIKEEEEEEDWEGQNEEMKEVEGVFWERARERGGIARHLKTDMELNEDNCIKLEVSSCLLRQPKELSDQSEPSVEPPVISPMNTGQTLEVVSQVFSCSQCPFVHSEEVKLQQHIEKQYGRG
ncbi:hypothetical protein AGOR_G00141400 [Albula goreensis]|uniref:TERF1-interacting nuclear factor 2 N-terminal domain-containing protein n=1 Tax=Albula goreensis TaxID=1534307 RepID=A0A8T3D4M8_9TELE|nr:hypothetical protein AGOR_G00141400 [Albula goreensis]